MSNPYFIILVMKEVSHYHRINATTYREKNSVSGFYNVVFRNEFFKFINHVVLHWTAKIEKGILTGDTFRLNSE
jgi:hypothetical protein